MNIDDLWTFKDIGGRGEQITGYKHVSVYHGFRYHPREVMRGAFDDWAYDQLGIYAFTVELWDMIGEAGIKERDFIEWFRNHPEEDDLKLLAWNDEQLDGKGFVNWRSFDHPQLGPVEIGGWIERRTFGNPPEKFLLQTLEPNTEFLLAHARMTPKLELRALAATALGEGLFRITAVIANSGYLPTYGSKRAQELRTIRPIEIKIELPAGAEIITGQATQDIGQLEGRASKRALWGAGYATDNLRKLEWVVRAPNGGSITVSAASQRAGTARQEVNI
jgi:hypothetical protein